MVDTPLQNLPDIRPGRRLANRYRLERLLASGGMASVWLATDTQLRRPVAVKLLHEHLRDPLSIERFRGEGKLAAQMSHPGIVAIYDTFHDQGIDGIVLEYVDGTTLRARLDENVAIPVAEAVSIARRLAEALAEAHRRGLVHRDIKPANVLLGTRGSVKLTDFGIAKFVDGADLTQPGTFVGTAKYLAPEQVTGEPVDGRADVYSLGVVLYEMLTGSPPFHAETDAATALARLQLPAPSIRRRRPDLPAALGDLVDRMLDRSPARRPETAQLVHLLAAHTNTEPPSAPPTRSASPATARQWPRALIPVALAVVGALGLSALLVGRTDAGRGLLEKLGLRDATTAALTAPVPLAGATISSFDPRGDDAVEHEDLIPFLTDDKPATVWTTETYTTRTFGGLKPGVGIMVDLGRDTTVSEIRMLSATTGWSAAVYFVDVAPDALEARGTWGDVRARREGINGDAVFTFAPMSGRTVLLWITDLGEAGQVRIGELQLRQPA